MRKNSEPDFKCHYCGRSLQRKRFSNNRLEDFTIFSRRKFCDRACMTREFRKRRRA